MGGGVVGEGATEETLPTETEGKKRSGSGEAAESKMNGKKTAFAQTLEK